MKQFLRGLLQICLSILYLLKWFIFLIVKRAWRDTIIEKPTSKSLVILGNGPSLINSIDELKIREKCDFCMVNDSPNSKLFFDLKPRYYVLADPYYFKSRPEKIIEQLNRVDWPMDIIVPIIGKRSMKKFLSKHKTIRVLFYNSNSLSDNFFFDKLKFKLFDKGLSAPVSQNVLVAAIFISIRMGYYNIELYGADHSWLSKIVINDCNEVCMRDNHFYDKEPQNLEPYLNSAGQVYKLHDLLRDFANMFANYYVLRKYADYKGNVRVINQTPNSFIDAFERNNIC